MTESDELQICELAQSVLEKFFPELKDQVSFSLEKGDGDSVSGHAKFGLMEVVITYGDGRILEPKYRWALVPLIAHELAHFISPIAPEDVMRKRLPASMMQLWEELIKAGYTKCSMERSDGS